MKYESCLFAVHERIPSRCASDSVCVLLYGPEWYRGRDFGWSGCVSAPRRMRWVSRLARNGAERIWKCSEVRPRVNRLRVVTHFYAVLIHLEGRVCSKKNNRVCAVPRPEPDLRADAGPEHRCFFIRKSSLTQDIKRLDADLIRAAIVDRHHAASGFYFYHRSVRRVRRPDLPAPAQQEKAKASGRPEAASVPVPLDRGKNDRVAGERQTARRPLGAQSLCLQGFCACRQPHHPRKTALKPLLEQRPINNDVLAGHADVLSYRRSGSVPGDAGVEPI